MSPGSSKPCSRRAGPATARQADRPGLFPARQLWHRQGGIWAFEERDAAITGGAGSVTRGVAGVMARSSAPCEVYVPISCHLRTGLSSVQTSAPGPMSPPLSNAPRPTHIGSRAPHLRHCAPRLPHRVPRPLPCASCPLHSAPRRAAHAKRLLHPASHRPSDAHRPMRCASRPVHPVFCPLQIGPRLPNPAACLPQRASRSARHAFRRMRRQVSPASASAASVASAVRKRP
jgi:hypothetical protein